MGFNLQRLLTDLIVTISSVIYGTGFLFQLLTINQFGCGFVSDTT